MDPSLSSGCISLLFIGDIQFYHCEIHQRFSAGNPAGYRATEVATKDKQTIDMQPISVPTISVDELKDITDNFGSNSLIGEGSYGRVHHGILKSQRAAAIKKLDSSKQPDHEFLAQVLP